jgi:hypothetical protein
LNFPVYDLDALFRQKMELPMINGRDQYVPKLPAINAQTSVAGEYRDRSVPLYF